MNDATQNVITRETEPSGRMDRLASLLAPPVESLGGRGTLVTPLILVFAVALLAGGAAWVWAEATPDSAGALLRQAPYLVWLLAFASPLAAAFKGALFAAMAWGVLVLLGGAPRVRPLLSALFYGEAVLSLQALWVTAGALLFGVRAAGPEGAFPVPSGLDAFVGSQGGVILAVAQQITPFHVAWVLFLCLAFAAHGGVSRWRGAGTALFLWCLGTGLAALRIPTP